MSNDITQISDLQKTNHSLTNYIYICARMLYYMYCIALIMNYPGAGMKGCNNSLLIIRGMYVMLRFSLK